MIENSFYVSVGKKIQALRKKNKISQQELAKKMGKGSATYVALIESGKRKVSLESLTKIAAILDTPMNQFIDGHYGEMDNDALLKLSLISDPNINASQRKLIFKFVEFLRSENQQKSVVNKEKSTK